MSYHGDLTEDATLDFTFTTHTSAGVPTTLAGTPALSVYKANGITQSIAGITLTPDFDSVTGLNHVRIDTSADAFYAVANDYDVIITTGTVGGVSVVGYTVGSFSIENRFDDANVTQWLGSAVNALVSGRVDASVGAMAANVLTAAAIATDAITAAKIATDAIGAAELATDGINEIRDAVVAGLNNPTVGAMADAVWDEARAGHVAAGSFGEGVASVQGNVTGSVGSVAGAVASVTAGVTVTTNSDKAGYSLAADQSSVTIGTVNALASGAIAAASLAAATCNKIADHVLRRVFATASASSDGDTKGFRSLLGAVAKLVNRIDTTTTAGKLTIMEANDVTVLGTQALTTDATADPVTVVDTDG